MLLKEFFFPKLTKSNFVLGSKKLFVEFLTTKEQQQKGFMFRPEPNDHFGLLFVYSKPTYLNFWMKNVPYDLDLLIFDSSQKLIYAQKLKANDETIVYIPKLASYALEVKSGFVKNNKLQVGDMFDLI